MDYALKLEPLDRISHYCGDAGFYREDDKHCFLAHIDALGHGFAAATAAQKTLEILESENLDRDLDELLYDLHSHLKGTVGIVAAIARLEKDSGQLELTGIGNIRVILSGSNEQSFPFRDGVIGYSTIHPKQQVRRIYPGDILVFTSDGIREHYLLEDYPELLQGDAASIAANYIECLSNRNDDSSCSVLRFCL